MYRIGQGFDFHRFGKGSHIVLGGVKIDFEKGVVAHSDGDVIIHSIIDAILGAIGFNDIGILFPNTDQSLKNIESSIMLKKVLDILGEKGYEIVNVDISFLAERPKIKDHREKIIKSLSTILGIRPENIGFKATTTEKMGAIGREEGIAASAVVLLRMKNKRDVLFEIESKEFSEGEDKVFIYTDGSCLGNPGPGGWAFIALKNDRELAICKGGEENTTNNRMEIKAVCEALKFLDRAPYNNITIFTDSQYVSNTLNAWLVNWEENGWKGSNKKDVANKDLWQEILSLLKKMGDKLIKFEWIKGHNKDFYNEKCDSLAQQMAKEYSKKSLF